MFFNGGGPDHITIVYQSFMVFIMSRSMPQHISPQGGLGGGASRRGVCL